jgi:uncharacterized protein YigE (DUF2233 family)
MGEKIMILIKQLYRNLKYQLVLFAMTILLVVSFTGITIAQEWQTIARGVEYKKIALPSTKEMSAVNICVVRADATKVKIRTVYTYRISKKYDPRQVSYSLNILSKALKPIALINGGFTASFSFPVPTGLLVDDGKTINNLNSKSKIQTGIFCVNQSKISIIKRSDYRGGCNNALQSGPIVVEAPGKVGISPSEKEKGRKFSRSLVGIDKDGRLLLIKSNKAFLYDLATLLIKEESAGGLNCIVALNLSGDAESGLYVPKLGPQGIIGNTDIPIASAIIITAK